MSYYEITIKGHIADYWFGSVDGMLLTRLPDGVTSIHGNIVDQSQLYGVLNKIRDMGLTLLEVRRTVKES